MTGQIDRDLDADRGRIIAAASRYLDALVSHDPSDVPLAPGAWRTEEGRNSGLGAEDIRQRMKSDQMNTITAIRDVRWYVDGPEAIALYLIDAAGATVHTAERFRVVDGLIEEIEAIFFISPVVQQNRWPVDPNEVWTVDNTPEGSLG